jgi:hypothetical protein
MLHSGMFCPILITDRRFQWRVAGWPLRCHEIHRLSTLLGQIQEGGAFGCHVLDRLQDCLEVHGIEIWIQIAD